MTQLVPTRPSAVAASPEVSSKAEQVAKNIRRIHDSLIGPRLRIGEVCKGNWASLAREIAASAPVRRDWFLLTGAAGDARRADVRRDLATIPARDVLQPLHDFAERTCSAPPNRAQVRLLVGLLIDAFPNARAHARETYFETLAFELEVGGYAPVAVACALRKLSHEMEFLPSLAEVLKAAEAEASAQRYHAQALANGLTARRWLEEAADACAAYEAGERTPAPPKPEAQPWKPGDPIPFSDDDEPSRRAEIGRDIRQLAQSLGARVR